MSIINNNLGRTIVNYPADTIYGNIKETPANPDLGKIKETPVNRDLGKIKDQPKDPDAKKILPGKGDLDRPVRGPKISTPKMNPIGNYDSQGDVPQQIDIQG